jgi:hypothetical protein
VEKALNQKQKTGFPVFCVIVQETSMTSKTKQWLGIGLLVLPPIGLMLTLSLYAIASFVITSVVMSVGDDAGMSVNPSVNILRVVFGLMGIVSALGILVGPFLGGYLIYTAGDDGSLAPRHRRIGELSLLYLFTACASILLRVPDLFTKVPEMKNIEDVGLFISSLGPTMIILGLAAVVTHFVAIVIFLFWIGRSANNLKLELKHKAKIDPFFLAWGNLVPIYNIFHPILTFPHFWDDVKSHYHATKEESIRVMWAIRMFFVADLLTLVLAYSAEDLGASVGLSKVQSLQMENYVSFVLFIVSTASLMYFVHTVTKHMEKR